MPSGTLLHLAGFSRHPSPSVTLHRLHTAPHLRAHRHRDHWDPVTNGLLTRVSPFSSPSTPPLCPPLTGMGMGAMGPSPRFIWCLGLRVSSRGQQFSPYTPPFQGTSSPAPSGSNITVAHLSFAGPQHTLVLVPYQGTDPRHPARIAASPCGRHSPLLDLAASSLQLSNVWQLGSCGHAYWVQSVQQDSGSCRVHPFRLFYVPYL